MYIFIIQEILNKYPHYEDIIIHSIQLSIVHLFIRHEIFIDTSVNAKEYLKLCKMNVISLTSSKSVACLWRVLQSVLRHVPH